MGDPRAQEAVKERGRKSDKGESGQRGREGS